MKFTFHLMLWISSSFLYSLASLQAGFSWTTCHTYCLPTLLGYFTKYLDIYLQFSECIARSPLRVQETWYTSTSRQRMFIIFVQTWLIDWERLGEGVFITLCIKSSEKAIESVSQVVWVDCLLLSSQLHLTKLLLKKRVQRCTKNVRSSLLSSHC